MRAVGNAARWLTDRVAASGRAPYPASYAHWGGGLSPSLTGALRCSREHHLLPVVRLRHRTPTGAVKVPFDTTTRTRAMPVGLWPAWALRLHPLHARWITGQGPRDRAPVRRLPDGRQSGLDHCGHPRPGRHRDRPRRLRTARHPYQPPRLHGRPPCPHTARRLLGRPRLCHRLRPPPGRLRLPQHLHRPEAVAKAARTTALQPRMFSRPRSAVALPHPHRHSTTPGPLRARRRYQPSASPVSAGAHPATARPRRPPSASSSGRPGTKTLVCRRTPSPRRSSDFHRWSSR